MNGLSRRSESARSHGSLHNVRDESNTDGAGDMTRPRKKQRKQRPTYSCDECRRLKMKCDRQVPCSNCVRRRCAEACNSAANGGTSPPSQEIDAERVVTTVHASPHVQSVSQTERRTTQYHEARASRQFTPNLEASREASEPVVQLLPEDASRNTLHAHPLGGVTVHGGSESANTLQIDNGEQSGSYGTLMIGTGGRSRYLGPTAGSEWLKDSETQDLSDSPNVTRAPTPLLPSQPEPSQSGFMASSITPVAFPFSSASPRISTREILSHLPPRDEAWMLVDSYYRYCAWHHDVAPRPQFENTFNRVYAGVEGESSSRVDPQELALVFIILAQGTIFNIEMPYYDSSIEDWLRLSEIALVKGEFLSNNTIAGLQTLHLMGHLQLHLDKGRRGDTAWPLWGLVMRLAQAMGMHRDGTRWGLPQEIVEERRKVFWEINSADSFQAHCFSRPCAVNPEHCDTEFPSQQLNLSGEKSYFILRFELSQISAEILNMAMKVKKPLYADVLALNLRLCNFEQNVPYSLRSRAAFLSMPSRFPQVEDAVAASPEPSRRSMIKSFQQMNLALNISETIINLHRPYFAKALYEDVDDRLASSYAPSFLTVIERCAIIINIVADIHVRYTAVSNRQWNVWFHVFGCALCLGTLLLRDPKNLMSPYVLTQIDAAIELFTSMIQHGAGTPRYRRNLLWLKKLRTRASAKMSATAGSQVNGIQTNHSHARSENGEEADDAEDVELLGWRTRLIERAGQSRQTIRTIYHPPTPTGSHATANSHSPQSFADLRGRQGQPITMQEMSTSMPVPLTDPDMTNDLLHEFWDPLLLQEVFGNRPLANQANNVFPWWEGDPISADPSHHRV